MNLPSISIKRLAASQEKNCMVSRVKCAVQLPLSARTLRKDDGEMRRFLQIARGSANELEYHLLLAKDLHLLHAAEFADLEAKVLEIQRMLASFAATVKNARAS